MEDSGTTFSSLNFYYMSLNFYISDIDDKKLDKAWWSVNICLSFKIFVSNLNAQSYLFHRGPNPTPDH